MQVFTHSFSVQFSAIADGSGLWNLDKGQRVDFSVVEVTLYSDDQEQWANINFYHEHSARDVGGLCYTDKGVEKACAEFVKRHVKLAIFSHVGGSEQGMQGDDFLSCDASVEHKLSDDVLLAMEYILVEE